MIYIVMYSLPGDHPEKEWKAYTTSTVTCKGYDVFFKLGYTRDMKSFKGRLKTFQSGTEGRVYPVCLFTGSKEREARLHRLINGQDYRKRKDLIEKYGSVECFDSISALYDLIKGAQTEIPGLSEKTLVLDAAELVWNNRICEYKNKISTITRWAYGKERHLTDEHVSRLKEQMLKDYYYFAEDNIFE